MTIPRRLQFDPSRPPWVHCVSRCVRRAFLCGTDREGRDLDHRKQWIEDRLRLIAKAAACEIASFAAMANHLHVIMRMVPEKAEGWSPQEVVERWLSLWPRERLSDGTPVLPSPKVVAALASDAVQVAKWRARLGDLGWTMKALKEDIARRANREDHCSGAFWEGRYKSIPLLDQAALVACMAYVDLNPIRASVADRPERSRFTSAYERIRIRQALRKASGLRRAGDRAGAERVLRRAGLSEDTADDATADGSGWLTPITASAGANAVMDLDEYLKLLDATGRAIRTGKRGAIPSELAPILARLDLDVDRWLACMLGWRQFLGAAVGRIAARAAEAARRGLQWVQNRCLLFATERVA